MPTFGPPTHPTQKAAPEVNRYWRRMMWDTELKRLYSHLDQVTHSIDSHQKKLYMENTFHDRARDRSTQLYAERISRENIGMFKRLMAVHTRRPREFLTHHVQNPKTHSRFLEYQRVMEDNHRLVDRLLSTRTFVNDRGSWDEHALEHEEMLLRLSHNPKNCFIPNLKAKRRRDQQSMKEQSITQQAIEKLNQKPMATQEQNAHLARADALNAYQEELKEQEAIHAQQSRYSYPLPPTSLPSDPNHPESARRSTTAGQHPTVLLPYGTHLVSPALMDQEQYNALSQTLADVPPIVHPSSTYSPSRFSRPRTYATTGDLSDAMLTIPMPPPSPNSKARQESKSDTVFFLQPAHHRTRSSSPDRRVGEADTPAYPFRFPPLESRDGNPLREEEEKQSTTTTQPIASTTTSHQRQPSTARESSHNNTSHLRGKSIYDAYDYPSSARAYDPSSTTSHLISPQPRDSSSPPPPLAHSTPSQSFLEYFHHSSKSLLGDSPIRPPERTAYVTHRPHSNDKGQSAIRGRSTIRRPTNPNGLQSANYQVTQLPLIPQPPNTSFSASQSTHHARFHREHAAGTSLYALSTSASSTSGAPRGSPAARKPQQRALEEFIDELFDMGTPARTKTEEKESTE